MGPLAQITCTIFKLTLLLILTYSTAAQASPFNHALSITSLEPHPDAPPRPRLAAPLQRRSPNTPLLLSGLVLSALNETVVKLLRSYQFHPASVAGHFLNQFLTEAYNITTLAPLILSEAIKFQYGLLELQMAAFKQVGKEIVQMTKKIVQDVVQVLGALVKALPMFFELVWEISSGLFVFVTFGIPPQWWWYRRDGLGVP
ncbi:MAG: hypothetical protein LQ348_004148 [Seirophora lacunosa]|nr:MAG: hypothetical protein LQ344_004116 [Seirophora lacunosa]KAI4187005.1 MAG: hypothetical protein LQ348_004148 [Seirophora lacunosa]